MSRFVDSNGGEWILKLRLGHRKALTDAGVGFDAHNFGSTMGSFVSICDDPDKVAKVVHLIAAQKPDGVTAEGLADSFDGESFVAAGTALHEEVIDFFHHGRPQTAEAARAAVRGILNQQDEATAMALTRSVSGTNSADSPALTPLA